MEKRELPGRAPMISRRFRDVLAAGPGIILCLLGASVFFGEWYRIGVVADPREIAGYFFGSESMAAHGGWKYRTASIYAWSSLAAGVLGLLPIILFVGVVRSGERKKLVRAYVAMAVVYLLIAFL